MSRVPTVWKRVALLAAVATAILVVLGIGSAGGGAGGCVSAFHSPPSNGNDPTCHPAVSISGVILWNFEGLLYRTFGGLVAIKTTDPQSPNFVTGYQVCPSCRFFSYSFTEHTTSAFKLVADGPKLSPDSTKERLVRIGGRYVLCDAPRRWFLVWYPHTMNFGLDCSPA